MASKTLSPVYIPPPLGGFNALNGRLSMPLADTIRMLGWIPYPDRLELRGAFNNHKTGSASPVAGLHAYYGLGGTNSLWATNDAGVYDVTTAGAWPGAAAIALTNGKTYGSVLSTGAATYLTLVNGTDNAVQYNGAAWAAIAAFGAVNTNTLSYVETYRQRLYFIVKNTLDVFYLAANAVAGAGTTYTFSSIFRRGGKLVALCTWTIDGGAGPDDNIVLMTSQGEVAVFSGNDPATWTLKGVYFVGRPVSDKPLLKYGGDILILCEAGVYPLSKALQSATIDRTLAVSNKITSFIQAALTANSSGWLFELVPGMRLLFLVINGAVPWFSPIGLIKPGVFAMHLDTGAWTQLHEHITVTGSTPSSLVLKEFNGALYLGNVRYGANSVGVYSGVKGTLDYSEAGSPIVGEFYQALSTFGYGKQKKLELIQPAFSLFEGGGTGVVTVTMGVVNDFQFDQASPARIPPATTTLPGMTTGGGTPRERYFRFKVSIPDNYSTWKGLYLKALPSSDFTKLYYHGADALVGLGGSF